MTTVEKPHLGLEYRSWQETRWGRVRYWLAHREEHKRGPAYFNPDHRWAHRSEFEDQEQEQPEQIVPEQAGESTPQEPLSWWEELAAPVKTVALWVVGALVLVLLFSPAPLFLALLLGGALGMLRVQHAKHRDSLAAMAEQVEEERAELAAQKQRAERKEQNRAAHEAERAALYEAKQAEREAKRAANREAHRGGEVDE